VIDEELRAYLDGRRRQVEAARSTAVHQNDEWAADGAMNELDRIEGWLNLRRERDRLDARLQEAASAPFVAEAER
jgi:hypothetical protein